MPLPGLGGQNVQDHRARFRHRARGSKAEFDFRFTNLYRDDVHIVNAYSSCGCTSVSITQPTLKSWEEGSIHAVFNTPTFLGSRSATITVVIDKPMPAEVLLNVRGVIRGDIVFEPASIEFGDINQGTEIEKKVRVSHYGWGEWQHHWHYFFQHLS